MDNSELLTDFLEESFDLVEKVKAALARWKSVEDKNNLINDIYRWVHTIKGGCAVFNFTETSKVAHALETRLGEFRKDVSLVKDRELVFIQDEIIKVDGLLRHHDALPEHSEEEASFKTNFFQDFYKETEIVIVDMIKDGFTFFEIEIPSRIASAAKSKLEEYGLAVIQENVREENVAFLMFANLKENETLLPVIQGLLDKFQGQWCNPQEEAKVLPAVTPSSSDSQTQPSEVLRVPLTSVNSVLDHIWELFLLHNQLSHLMKQHQELFQDNHSFLQQFEGLDTRVERTIQELESKTMSMRTGPVKKVFDRMAKVVEDYSKQTGKKINLITAGEGIDLDKKVLDALSEPLIHLIRNAIDHGIENSGQRYKCGKGEMGNVELSANVSGNEVNIIIKDDGKGIDPQKILESARKKNMNTAHLKTEQEIIGLIFEPGFSTAEKVSDVSGRGVGMDAVKKSIHELGGEVGLDTKVGQGTTFRITLPLSMSVSKSLIVKVRDLQYAFSTKSILFVEKIVAHSLKKNGQDEYYSYNDDLIPCYDLGLILPDHRKHPDLPITHTHVCVISHKGKSVAFRVDEIVQTLNLVMKPVPRLIPKNLLLSGVTVLPDGNPIFVLNVLEAISLLKEKRSGGPNGQKVA